MRLHKTAASAAVVAGIAVVTAAPAARGASEPARVQRFSDASTAALSRQIAAAVTRGDTPGVVEIVVNRDGVLYEAAAGQFDVAHNIPSPRTPSSLSRR